jgi:hypothetical protein
MLQPPTNFAACTSAGPQFAAITSPARCPSWVAPAILALIALNVFDLGLSLLAQRSNILTVDTEQNPIAASLIGQGGIALTNFKLSLVAAGATGLFLSRRSPLARFGVTGLLAVYTFVALNWLGFIAAIVIDGYHSDTTSLAYIFSMR